MAPKLSHEKMKQEYLRYRERAREMFEDVGSIDSAHIKIPTHAPVQVTDSGAFVEAIVWVPKEKL